MQESAEVPKSTGIGQALCWTRIFLPYALTITGLGRNYKHS